MGDDNRIDWNRIVERVTWAAVTIASLLWGGSQQVGRWDDRATAERATAQRDVAVGEGLEWGRPQAYYDAARDALEERRQRAEEAREEAP